jgi:outer membrane protein assembly factor BamB
MKRRVLFLPLSDQSNYQDEHLNELATKRLMNRLENSGTIVCVDPLTTDIKGDPLTPQAMDRLNELYGIQAIIKGTLSDIYITTSRGDGRDEKEVSMAVSKVSLDVYNTETGSILRQISARNPFSLSRERGEMSPEKAKLKAIDLAIELLTDDLLKTILTLDWHARIARVDNEKVYVNAGRLSGLDKGDVLEVYAPGDRIVDKTTAQPLGRTKGSYKGELEVVEVFGVDASWGKAGKTVSFASTDLVYLKKQ